MSDEIRIEYIADPSTVTDVIASIDASIRTSAWSASSWGTTLAGNTATLIAYVGDVPAGFACFAAMYEQGELLMVGVLPAYRRLGLARRLVQQGEAQTRWLGATEIHLEVASQNAPAIALYTALGYETIGRRKAYYPDGDDALLMVLRFAVCAG